MTKKLNYKQKTNSFIKGLFLTFCLLLSLNLSISIAQTLNFQHFNSLPDSQGWTYITNITDGIHSISDSLLVQNSIGNRNANGFYMLDRGTVLSTDSSWTLDVRARVIEIEEKNNGFFFNVVQNNLLYSVRILPTQIYLLDETNFNYLIIDNDNTIFHNFKLEKLPNGGMLLSIDDTIRAEALPVDVASFDYPLPYDLAFGDGSDKSYINAHGEWASYKFSQYNIKPIIIEVVDVPNDQGGWVKIKFEKTIYDTDSLLIAQTSSTEMYTVEIDDGSGWTAAANTAAYGKSIYTVLVPTTKDSTTMDGGSINFRVIASMEEGNFFSNTITGYSLDNISPATPANLNGSLTSESMIRLSWSQNNEKDFLFYNLYRSVDNQNFELIIETIDLTYLDTNVVMGVNYSYIIEAVDYSGNKSALSEPMDLRVPDIIGPSITEVVDVPNDQGGWVKIKFEKTVYDTDSLILAKTYSTEMYTIEIDDGSGWTAAANTAAYGKSIYAVLVPTTKDSTQMDNGNINFRVIASMEEGTFFSNTITGYSLDNISPATPANFNGALTSESMTRLSWSPNNEKDFHFYNLYRSVDNQSFELIIETIDSTYLDTNVVIGMNYSYKIEAVDYSGNKSTLSQPIDLRVTDIGIAKNIPYEYSLSQNYPNPFNPATKISYQLPKNSFVNLVVYNSLGQEIAELVNQNQSTGLYAVSFNASNLPSGVYIIRLKAGDFSAIKKMILAK